MVKGSLCASLWRLTHSLFLLIDLEATEGNVTRDGPRSAVGSEHFQKISGFSLPPADLGHPGNIILRVLEVKQDRTAARSVWADAGDPVVIGMSRDNRTSILDRYGTV